MRTCPECGSQDLEPSTDSQSLDLGLSMSDNWVCNNCGYEGTALTDSEVEESDSENHTGPSILTRASNATWKGEAPLILFVIILYLIAIFLL